MKVFKILLSILYISLINIRNWLYDIGFLTAHNFSTPIISIGNITAGGNGKTPMVVYIAKKLIDKDYCIGIISRGYKKKSSGTVIVSNGKKILCDVISCGDEAYLMAKNCPESIIIVDKNKIRAIEIMIGKFNPDLILIDDGFQFRKIKKTLDIILINIKIPIDLYKFLPHGLLREPISNIKRADMIITTYGKELNNKINIDNNIPLYNSNMRFSIKKGCNGELISSEITNDLNILAFCGIAHPDLFINAVKESGIKILEQIIFIDHAAYTKTKIDKIDKLVSNKNIDCLITTEKDFVKLPSTLVDKYNIYVLCMDINFGKDYRVIDKLLFSIK